MRRLVSALIAAILGIGALFSAENACSVTEGFFGSIIIAIPRRMVPESAARLVDVKSGCNGCFVSDITDPVVIGRDGDVGFRAKVDTRTRRSDFATTYIPVYETVEGKRSNGSPIPITFNLTKWMRLGKRGIETIDVAVGKPCSITVSCEADNGLAGISSEVETGSALVQTQSIDQSERKYEIVFCTAGNGIFPVVVRFMNKQGLVHHENWLINSTDDVVMVPYAGIGACLVGEDFVSDIRLRPGIKAVGVGSDRPVMVVKSWAQKGDILSVTSRPAVEGVITGNFSIKTDSTVSLMPFTINAIGTNAKHK